MLYQHWQALGLGALLFTILSFFSESIFDRNGKIFFMWLSGILWPIFALGTLSMKIVWDGGVILNHTHMPVNGQESLALLPGFMGFLMLVIAFANTVEYYAYKPAADAARKVDRGR